MIRHRLRLAALPAFVLWLSVSLPAAAGSPPGAGSVWRVEANNPTAISRSGKSAGSNPTYEVAYQSGDQILTRLFPQSSAAEAFSKKEKESVVIDGQTGAILYTNASDPYELTTWGVSRTVATPRFFSSLQSAVAAGQALNDASVTNRFTGAVLWSDANNFQVVSGAQAQDLQSLDQALAAAAVLPNATVTALPLGVILWKAAYDVQVNGSFLASFATLASAKAFAATRDNAEVTDIATGQDVWDDIPRYGVYKDGALLRQFAYLSDAVAYAKTLSGVTVLNLATKATVFSNLPNYLVQVGAVVKETFPAEAPAIAYARTVKGAVVIEAKDGAVVWSATGEYGVFRYKQFVQSFATEAQAVAYAKTLDHVQVVDVLTGAVLFSNYPETVRSPIGDFLTVENGMAVDHWGKATIVLAPAPSFMTAGSTYVSNDFLHWYLVGSSSDTYAGQWENPYQTFNLETESLLTAAQINAFFAANAAQDSVLQNTGQYFIEAQNAYGVNAQYLVAHAIIESAWGTSFFATNRDNLFGYEAYTSDPNAAASFRSIEYDINFQAWFVRNSYLSPTGPFYNGANLDGMNVDYATDPYWANSIARIMSEIAPYGPQVQNQPLLPEGAVRPFFPYPGGARGLVTWSGVSVTANVYNQPADAQTGTLESLVQIPKNTIIPVLGDSPGWDKVIAPGGTTGFIDWNLISLQNMVEVTGIAPGGELNLRSGPSTSDRVVDQVPNGVYLVYLKRPDMGWYEVRDGNGMIGYADAQYLRVIH